jgi:hypothetical protein
MAILIGYFEPPRLMAFTGAVCTLRREMAVCVTAAFRLTVLDSSSRQLHGVVTNLIIIQVAPFCYPLDRFTPTASSTPWHHVGKINIESTFLTKSTLMVLLRSSAPYSQRMITYERRKLHYRAGSTTCNVTGMAARL